MFGLAFVGMPPPGLDLAQVSPFVRKKERNEGRKKGKKG